MSESHDGISNIEDQFFEAAKRLLTAWSSSGRVPDFQRIAERHELDASLVEKLYATLCPGSRFFFHPSIVEFQSYAEIHRERPEPAGMAIELANNENALGPSSKVVDLLRSNLDRLGTYPPLSDLHLRQRLAIALDLREDHLVLGRGANHLISEIAFAFLAEGDPVSICDCSFPVYSEMAKRSACRVNKVPVRADYTYDVDTICRSFADNPRIVFVGSPNNPTGTLLEQDDFSYILKQLPPATLLVLDECYRDFAAVDSMLPATFEAIKGGRNVISLRSFSKAHGLASLRVGYAVARPEIASYLEKRREPYHAGQLDILACLTALDDPGHVVASVELVRRERSWLVTALANLGIQVWPSHGNFLFFHAVPLRMKADAVRAAKEITQRLERQHGIRIRNLGGGFNVPGHLRVTVGRPQDNARFIEGLISVLEELPTLLESKPTTPPNQSV